MPVNEEWFVRTDDGKVYGPAGGDLLRSWARDGRIGPSSSVSCDRVSWMPASHKPDLEMDWLVELEPGRTYGPFNRAVVRELFQNGSLPKESKIFRRHEYPIDCDPPVQERIVEREVRVEVPVEKIVEKEVRVEVPVERQTCDLVVPEVVEVSPEVPKPTPRGVLFENVGRGSLAALEAAARRELSTVKGRRLADSLFGRK